MREGKDLDEMWALALGVLEGGRPLELTAETRDLISRTAQQVALNQQDAEEALRSVPTATPLLRQIQQRIRDSSYRLGEARDRVDELQQKGDYSAAVQVMRDLIAVEVVPFYRKLAEVTLNKVTQLADVLATGRLNPDLPDRPQLAALSQRVQQGHALELTDDLRALLRRTAPTAAVSEVETEEALKTPEGAEALMQMVLSRFRDGERRFLRAMYRMTSLRDAGNVEGARQQMRDVLAVEVVPLYREMAEEQLRGLDSPPPSS
jgi:DUSAM domain-containing protein